MLLTAMIVEGAVKVQAGALVGMGLQIAMAVEILLLKVVVIVV